MTQKGRGPKNEQELLTYGGVVKGICQLIINLQHATVIKYIKDKIIKNGGTKKDQIQTRKLLIKT